MKYSEVNPDQIFFEDMTGEYYQKTDGEFSVLYNVYERQPVLSDSGPIESWFAPDQEVKIIKHL